MAFVSEALALLLFKSVFANLQDDVIISLNSIQITQKAIMARAELVTLLQRVRKKHSYAYIHSHVEHRKIDRQRERERERESESEKFNEVFDFEKKLKKEKNRCVDTITSLVIELKR